MADGGILPVAAAARVVRVADLFCGAGGSSTGARQACAGLGLRIDLVAVNHWNVAIETHSLNHPEARHYLRDLMAADPIRLVPEGRLDLLMASPTCTHHSRARGGKPSSDQQRMDPWAVVRWCSDLRVKRLLVENVPEFQDWGPIDLRSGRPIRRRRGEYFRAWVEALKGVGFRVDWRLLNAADYGDATTRVRFFLIARSDGRRIRWPEPTHSRGGDLFGTRPWRPAREIIDWSIEGRSIYDRKRPLAPATLARIHAGVVKFRWPEPYLVVLRRHMAAQSIDLPLTALCAGGTHVGLAEPFLLNRHGDNGSARGHSLDEPMPTADCRGAGYLVEPFVAALAHGSPSDERNPDGRRCRSLDDPLQTIQAQGGKFGIVEPFVMSGQRDGAPCSITEPMPGMTAQVGSALIAPYYGSGSGATCGSADDPLPTATARARFGLVVPITHRDGSNRARSFDDPLPTITTAHRGELAAIEPSRRQWDIRFRMLQPHELAAAMGFAGQDAAYQFAGNKTEVTKQIGNAVPVNTAAALVEALFR